MSWLPRAAPGSILHQDWQKMKSREFCDASFPVSVSQEQPLHPRDQCTAWRTLWEKLLGFVLLGLGSLSGKTPICMDKQDDHGSIHAQLVFLKIRTFLGRTAIRNLPSSGERTVISSEKPFPGSQRWQPHNPLLPGLLCPASFFKEKKKKL